MLVEKHRPSTVTDVLGQDYLKKIFQWYLERGDYPHILLYGPPGTGKTSSLEALCKDFYLETYNQNFKELNASDDRGIDTVRGAIKSYSKNMAYGGYPFKTILLDEMDALTSAAQNALRRTMESSQCRFVATTNHPDKIIDAIKSRFVMFKVSPIPTDILLTRIKTICSEEGLEFSDKLLSYIVNLSKGDLRYCLTTLDSLPPKTSLSDFALTSPLIFDEEVEELLGDEIEKRWTATESLLRKSGNDGVLVLERLLKMYSNSQVILREYCIEAIADGLYRLKMGLNPLAIVFSTVEKLKRYERNG